VHECQTTLPQPVGGWLETAGEGKPDRMRRRPVRIIMPPAPRWRSQGPTRPLDLPNVLNTLVESVARLCEADKGVILRQSGEDASYYVAASYHQTSRYAEYLKNLIFAPGRSSVVPRVLLEGKSVQIPDVFADPEYTSRELATVGDFRTVLGVPLLRDGFPIGVLVLHRAAVSPFTEKQSSWSRPSPTKR